MEKIAITTYYCEHCKSEFECEGEDDYVTCPYCWEVAVSVGTVYKEKR